MSDATVAVLGSTDGAAKLIDNREVTNDNGDPVLRQRVEVAQPDATAAVATVTASGSTTVITPASGKRLRVYWMYAVPDPDSSDSPLIKISLGGTEIYRTYGVTHQQRFTGPVDGVLAVDLSASGSVAVTVHYEEVD